MLSFVAIPVQNIFSSDMLIVIVQFKSDVMFGSYSLLTSESILHVERGSWNIHEVRTWWERWHMISLHNIISCCPSFHFVHLTYFYFFSTGWSIRNIYHHLFLILPATRIINFSSRTWKTEGLNNSNPFTSNTGFLHS